MEYKIHLYCGDGKGKTTCSTGLAIRALGSGKKVVFTQFLKDGTSCELCILKKLDNITVLCIEEPQKFFFMMTEQEKAELISKNNELFKTAIAKITEENMLLVLDECIGALAIGAIDKNLVLDFLHNNPQCEIALTGRDPSDELIELADYVSNIEKIKHPFDSGVCSRKGVEF